MLFNKITDKRFLFFKYIDKNIYDISHLIVNTVRAQNLIKLIQSVCL